MVKRVAARVGRGLTLKLALAAENQLTVNEETWKKALHSHPELSPHYEAGKGKFLDRATQRLSQSAELANLRWLLERRHPDLFAKPADVEVNVSNTNVIELPADIVERARALAKREDRGSRVEDGKRGK